MTVESALDITLAYHRRTRHYPFQYARSLGFLDWDTQPDPFRVYEGAPLTPLALRPPDQGPRYEPPWVEGNVAPAPLNFESISQLFQDSLGLSAWKQAGEARWALRVNPSSGNLHPTEGYLVAGPVPGLCEQPGVFHYRPDVHGLERRGDVAPDAWRALAARLPAGAFLVGFTSIALRESWKYGERAFRYCQHDLGHAIGALAVAAAALGWRVRLMEAVPDEALARLLGVAVQEGPEAERAEALVLVSPTIDSIDERLFHYLLVTINSSVVCSYSPRALASDHQDWPVIDEVYTATTRLAPPPPTLWADGPPDLPALPIGDAPFGLRAVVHQRRSAVDMDGHTGLTAAAFQQILLKLTPGPAQVPFTALPWRPRIDLLFFVHRVAGMDPGLYALPRDPARLDTLSAAMDPGFSWERTPGPAALYRLASGDARAEAAGSSCGQAIASDGCFAVAMLADLDSLREAGAWFYRRLHWEAGLLGQVLYLEAEASGVSGTGIGCFFDESSARVFGLRTERFAVLYHFAVGGRVDDPRLSTLPPYAHLDRDG